MFNREAESGEQVLQMRCSPFLGVLKRQGQKYEFSVRYGSRKQPLIWGADFDFDTAVREVARILLGLQNRWQQAEHVNL
jgi:hypothetical protein